MQKLHAHPDRKLNLVWGKRLKEGDTIEQGDLYASTNGEWEQATCLGIKIEKNCTTYWVRMGGRR